MKITRKVEELAGVNRYTVRRRLGNIHCMTPIRDQLKLVRPAGIRDAPPELRRGWVLCVLETIQEYRGLYIGVVHPPVRPKLTWKD